MLTEKKRNTYIYIYTEYSVRGKKKKNHTKRFKPRIDHCRWTDWNDGWLDQSDGYREVV